MFCNAVTLQNTIICDTLICSEVNLFMCMSFKHFRNFGKRMKRKCKLRYICLSLKTVDLQKCFLTVSLCFRPVIFSRVSPFGLLEVGRSAFPFVQKTGGLLLFIDKLKKKLLYFAAF